MSRVVMLSLVAFTLILGSLGCDKKVIYPSVTLTDTKPDQVTGVTVQTPPSSTRPN